MKIHFVMSFSFAFFKLQCFPGTDWNLLYLIFLLQKTHSSHWCARNHSQILPPLLVFCWCHLLYEVPLTTLLKTTIWTTSPSATAFWFNLHQEQRSSEPLIGSTNLLRLLLSSVSCLKACSGRANLLVSFTDVFLFLPQVHGQEHSRCY